MQYCRCLFVFILILMGNINCHAESSQWELFDFRGITLECQIQVDSSSKSVFFLPEFYSHPSGMMNIQNFQASGLENVKAIYSQDANMASYEIISEQADNKSIEQKWNLVLANYGIRNQENPVDFKISTEKITRSIAGISPEKWNEMTNDKKVKEIFEYCINHPDSFSSVKKQYFAESISIHPMVIGLFSLLKDGGFYPGLVMGITFDSSGKCREHYWVDLKLDKELPYPVDVLFGYWSKLKMKVAGAEIRKNPMSYIGVADNRRIRFFDSESMEKNNMEFFRKKTSIYFQFWEKDPQPIAKWKFKCQEKQNNIREFLSVTGWMIQVNRFGSKWLVNYRKEEKENTQVSGMIFQDSLSLEEWEKNFFAKQIKALTSLTLKTEKKFHYGVYKVFQGIGKNEEKKLLHWYVQKNSSVKCSLWSITPDEIVESQNSYCNSDMETIIKSYLK